MKQKPPKVDPGKNLFSYIVRQDDGFCPSVTEDMLCHCCCKPFTRKAQRRRLGLGNNPG